MFLEERQNQIVSLLEREGRVSVSDLAERFSVTEDCIRKDLRHLVADGRCRRVYGGATRIEPEVNRRIVSRVDTFRPEKQAVATKALGLIGEHQAVFLDASSTNILLARLIANTDISCMIVTNSVDVAHEAAANPRISVVCPGGNFNSDYNGFIGAMTASIREGFRFDVGFLGDVGIDPYSGDVLTLDLDDGPVKRVVLQNSEKRILLCTADKLGHSGSFRYATLEDFDLVLADDPSQKAYEPLHKNGVMVR